MLKDRMKVLLVSPPRRFWPFISEGDNYLLPQWLVCLGAVLRGRGYDMKIIDCMPLRMGWRSLLERIREERPQIVATGENHALYVDEALKLFNLVKELDPRIITIAGGAHFSNLYKRYAILPEIDYIVLGEGEETLVSLLEELEKPSPDPSKVRGIAFERDGKVHITEPRPLIEDLDSLPLPAYDLVPMKRYGMSKYLFSPGGTTIHHSRGCTTSCSFCVWWTQMGERRIVNGEIRVRPVWRTKSVERTIDEIGMLKNLYDKNCLVFVDESWNIDPHWNLRFAEKLIESRLNIRWFAFMRADCLIRDEKLGILKELVRSGLSHVCIGVERAEDEDLKSFNKPFYSNEISLECFRILKEKYPHVFRQATFIVGIRNETRRSIQKQAEYAKKLCADYPAFHPLTPVPGTPIYEEALEKGWLEDDDWRHFDWMTPVISSKFLTREEISLLIYEINKRMVTFPWLLKGLLSRSEYKRNMYIWWTKVLISTLIDSIKAGRGLDEGKNFTHLVTPKWYDR